MHADRQFQARAMAEKIDGYVLKEQVYLDLITAIKTVHSGERYYCPNLGKQRESMPAANIGNIPSVIDEQLTTREREIVILIASGLSNKLIADKLQVSVRTIEKHCNNIHRKLNVHNAVEVTRYAIRNGLLPP
jgi:DNA-binding NarL/FixJ family response regulator